MHTILLVEDNPPTPSIYNLSWNWLARSELCARGGRIDNGHGFDSATALPGRGLQNIRRRAALSGTGLELDSGPKGTALRLTLPD